LEKEAKREGQRTCIHWWKEMSEQEIFFTGDEHFNHSGKPGKPGIIQHCNRPFKDIEEMNEELIIRWNEVVPTGGLVYVNGDFAWGKGKGYETLEILEILDRLNGVIYLIRGSHDKPLLKLYKQGHRKLHGNCPMVHKLTIDGKVVVLCHYCMRVWPQSHYNSLHLFAHSHARLEAIGKSLDVGVDGHNFYPWSWDEIKEYMEDRPHNFNYVGGTHSGRGL